MRISFVLPQPGMAGGIRVIAIYAQRLQQRGHKVTLVSTPWLPPGRRARTLHRMRNWLDRINPGGVEAVPSHLDGIQVEHHHLRRQRVTNNDVPDGDVVIATWWETAHWVAALSPSKGAKAYFVQDYGAHAGQPIDQIAATWTLPLHKIAISRWLVQLIYEHCGATQVDYVPNAVDLEQFYSPPRSKQRVPTVGFQFSAAPQKGCDVIIAALERARCTVPNLRAVSYGPGDPKIDMPLPAYVEHFMNAPEHALRGIYCSCDAWLFASRREGFGLPILEAMACRTPVIGTRAGAAPELLQAGGGVLIRSDDPDAMASAIERIVNLPDAEWRAMSEKAHGVASQFTWDDATSLFEQSLFRAVDSAADQHPELAGASQSV